MSIRLALIRELKIFDVATLKGRSRRTLFSAVIDGEVIYSKALFEVRELHSGRDTVGAFKDDNKASLFAWIDPVSGAFLFTTDDGTFRPYMLVAAFVLILLTLIAMFLARWADPDVGLLVVPALLGVLVAFALKKVADRKLEMALRAALRELK
jgi:hypothetical protein